MADRPLPYTIAVLCDLRDRDGRVLLIRRAKEPNLGMCSMIGGKLDTAAGESPAQCARREIMEEADIDIPLERLRLVGMVSEQAYLGIGHWLMFIYSVDGPVEVQPRVIREGRLEWHAPEELDSLPQPETDRKVIWPLLREMQGRFFSVHIDCTNEEMTWRVEQAE
ncbi:MAG: NUDIX domain-containing protein [Phycisphaeraceae bacterium]|nr:MAG: NUDIX domain-containing protein [Phycisphaeraceae bacterium]